MGDKVKIVTKSSFPVLSVLGAVLVVLKLLGYINISWMWVLAPFWAPWVVFLGIMLLIFLAFGAVLLGAVTIDGWSNWRSRVRIKKAQKKADALNK